MDKKRKKLSGNQFRNQRQKRDIEKEKLKGTLQKFLEKPEQQNTQDINIEHSTDTTSHNIDKNSVGKANFVGPSTSSSNAPNTNSDEDEIFIQNEGPPAPVSLVKDSESLLLPSDPGMWNLQKMTDKMRQTIVEKSPLQVKEYTFPVDELNRHFSTFHYKRTLPNGEFAERPWVLYSISKNAVYCFCCMLFSNVPENNWLKSGYSDWKNLSRALQIHETSQIHREAFKRWKELDQRLKNRNTIDDHMQAILDTETEYWRKVLARIISIIKLLSGQCLALRGSTEKLYAPDNGNFLKLVELLAEYDIVMKEHVRRINYEHQSNKSWSVNYLSNTIQDEIITLIGAHILREIVRRVKKSKYFSIIADCTPDVSKVEQLSVVLRALILNETLGRFEIQEYFMGFFEATDQTGQGLADEIIDQLQKVGLDIKNIRGQGYDNGANMKGVKKGVQTRISQRNSRVTFVPCACHSLNLVINDAASCSGEITGFFGIIQEIYVFFSASPKRWSVLLAHLTNLTLKPLSTTRWSSRIDALKPLRYQLGEIYDALLDIVQNPNTDSETKNKGTGLAKNIKNYKFICSLIVWYEVLFQVNKVSLNLQSPNTNLPECANLLDQVIKHLESYRAEGFKKIQVSAKELAEELEIIVEFEREDVVRPRRKKRQFQYESVDEAPQNSEEKFKISFYNCLLDVCLMSLKERFTELETHSDRFNFLVDIHGLKSMDVSELEACCKDLHLSLTDEGDSDINGIDLLEELLDLRSFITIRKKPLEILEYLKEFDLISLYPNTVVALRILLTIPVTVASGERSFSKLKLIKTYLRSTLSQSKVSNLAILSIESELAGKLDYSVLIDEFAKLKVRRVKL